MMSRIPLYVALCVFLACLAGCFGGGGGGGTATFTYTTDWTKYQSSGGGQSERVQLFSPSGAIVNSFILNVGTASASFPNLPAGSYHLMVQLYSSQNAGGVEVGDLDTLVSLPQTTSFTTYVGLTVTSLAVTPSQASVNVQQSQQFYVAGYAAVNKATFIQPNSITWSVFGAIGSIDPVSGLFLGTNPGSGSVQAAQASTGLKGAAIVSVMNVQTVHGKWTVMVYMNAANDLSEDSPLNFEQMQKVANAGTDVRTIVQWKQVSSLPYPAQFNGTRRYLIQPSQSDSIASKLIQDMGTGVDMGSYQTLLDFINWTKTYYPADHYCLVVWDHGAGWQRSEEKTSTRAVSFDDDTGNSIQTWQLSQAVGNNNLDILAWDSSLMQMAEVADELRDKVTYIVGSEESPPGTGYPYDLVLQKVYTNALITPLDFSKSYVDGMIQEYGNSGQYKITQSVIATSKFPALLTAVKNLGTALDANVGSLGTAIPAARAAAQSYSLVPNQRYYYDMYDITSKIDAQTSIPAINTADAQLRVAIGAAIVYEAHNSLSPGSHGVSIDFSPSSVFVSYASDYAQLRFASDTNWSVWLNQAP